MKQLFSLLSLSVSVMSTLFAQTELDLINAVNLDSLSQTLQEFTGEVATNVGGNSVTILNREQSNNDLAGDYLVEKFNAMLALMPESDLNLSWPFMAILTGLTANFFTSSATISLLGPMAIELQPTDISFALSNS